jgi:hypothetical protein
MRLIATTQPLTWRPIPPGMELPIPCNIAQSTARKDNSRNGGTGIKTLRRKFRLRWSLNVRSVKMPATRTPNTVERKCTFEGTGRIPYSLNRPTQPNE